ncbi:hypothetical protein GGF32_003209 [Allomyces javanicus]|nr:hypothetical protein GGF32_003209 [Allomyces javanicus]
MANVARNFRLVGTTVVDPTLASVVSAAIANGSTVVSFNSGDSLASQTGVLYHVGQPEYTAGFKVGTVLGRSGKSHVMCIIDEVGNSALVLRCSGVADGIQSMTSSAQIMTPNMDGSSMAALDVGINTALTNNPSIDAIVTLSADTGLRAMQVVQSRGLGASIAVATFDFNAAVLTAISQSKILLAVDQQGFLQTFATVQLLKVYHMTGGMRLATQVLLSGPLLINSGNVLLKQCQIDPTQTGCTVVLPSSITIGMVATGTWSGETFYQQAKFGALAAVREHGTNVRFIDTSLFDLQALSSQVSTLITQGISALVLPVPSVAPGQDYTALIDAAAAANIPVITWGTGMVRGAARVQFGKAAMHLGQNETLSGLQVGARLDALIPVGAQVLCVTQELGSDDMPLKCAGIQAALTNGRSVAPAGIVSSSAPLQQLVLAISVRNTEQSTVTIRQALTAYPQVAAIVYPTVEAARMVLNAIPAGRNMVVAGYGLNLDVATQIAQGSIAFTANEQPFLQGYLAAASLSFYLTHGYLLQNPLLETGPFFVNATKVAQYACMADTSRDPSTECPACSTLCSINGVCLDSGECACKSGWLLGPNLDCQEKDPGLQFIAHNSGVGIAFSLLAALGMAVALGLAGFIFAHRTHPLIKAFSWTMCVGMQFGVVLVLTGVFLGVGIPTSSVCAAQPFVLSIGFSTVIGSLVAKTARLALLFTRVQLRRNKISDLKVISWTAAIVAVNVVICIAWIAVAPPVPHQHVVREGVTNVVCASRNEGMGDAFQGALIAYNVLLILAGAILGFLTRSVHAQFNESKQIGAVMYNLTVLAAIGIPLSLTSADNVTLAFSIQSLLIFLGCMSTNGLLFAPKILAIINQKRQNHDDINIKIQSTFLHRSSGRQHSNRGARRALAAHSTTAATKISVETLVLRTAVRIHQSRLDAIIAPWKQATLFLFNDGKAPMLAVFDVDHPARFGTTVDLSQVKIKVVDAICGTTVSSALISKTGAVSSDGVQKTGAATSFTDPGSPHIKMTASVTSPMLTTPVTVVADGGSTTPSSLSVTGTD